jgi:hypothetical protein
LEIYLGQATVAVPLHALFETEAVSLWIWPVLTEQAG